MRSFPIFMVLHGRRVLIVGTGEVAARKADPLRRAGAEVHMTAGFSPEDLDGCCLAVGADAPEADLLALSAHAIARGIPVNVVDRPALCSFITPSIIDRDPVTIAVGSAGTAPVLARLLRAKIEALVPPAYGRLALLAERVRDQLRARLPALGPRRRALEQAFTGKVAELVFAGRDDEAEAMFRADIETAAARPATGIVHLVGAGPGAADLLTLRAQRLLGEADVIVHDRLISAEVLDMARRDADRIYVGKVRAHHCVPQDGINALLVQLAREGKKVVRLKGGDPYVFGRGGEEAEELAAAGVSFEVVPGITAALACAAQAGIPLTHREIARTLTLITGHTKEGAIDMDFPTLARGRGTLAVYMGVVTLPLLCRGLLSHGMDPATPAALIENGGSERQREIFARLDTLAGLAHAWGTTGPTLVLIGLAVGRRSQARPGALPLDPTKAEP